MEERGGKEEEEEEEVAKFYFRLRIIIEHISRSSFVAGLYSEKFERLIFFIRRGVVDGKSIVAAAEQGN